MPAVAAGPCGRARFGSPARCSAVGQGTGVARALRLSLLSLITALGGLSCESRRDLADARPSRATSAPVLSDWREVCIGRVELTGRGDVDLLSDGAVVVFEPAESAIYELDPAGALRHKFGRRGRGPGEFSIAVRLQVGPEDEIAVADIGNNRLSLFRRDGNIMWEHVVKEGLVWALTWNASGLWLRAQDGGEVGVYRIDVRTGAVADTLMRTTQVSRGAPGDTGICRFCASTVTPEPRVVMAYGDTAYHLVSLDRRGRAQKPWFHADAALVRYSGAEREDLDRSISSAAASIGVAVSGAGAFRFKPRVASASIAPDSSLWVVRSLAETDTATSVDVFSANGALLRTMRLPLRARRIQLRWRWLVAQGEDATSAPMLVVAVVGADSATGTATQRPNVLARCEEERR